MDKVEIAAIMGTFQSALTDFRYLRSVWKKNAEEERLLGVSLTGIMDNALMANKLDEEYLKEILDTLKQKVIRTNEEYANLLGIAPSVATTTIKPSGTVSQLVDSSSGIHPRFSSYYNRRVRNDKKDPLSSFLIGQGVPYEEDKMNKDMLVFSFPMSAPNAVTTDRKSVV